MKVSDGNKCKKKARRGDRAANEARTQRNKARNIKTDERRKLKAEVRRAARIAAGKPVRVSP